MDMNNIATAAGVICAALGTVIGSLLTLWWTKGTEARVRLIKAESDAHHRSQSDVIIQKDAELARKDVIIGEKEATIGNNTQRITTLEANYEKLRQVGHDDRNKWHEDSIKCARETAELKGQVTVLQSQLDMFLKTLRPLTPVPVSLSGPTDPIHPNPIPVRSVDSQ